MKALSLTQPWATLVAIGAKRYETRSWSTGYRGPLAIHASKGFPVWAKDLALTEPFRSALQAGGIWRLIDLPRGMVIAMTRLVTCYETGTVRRAGKLTANEVAFGDWAAGRFAWEFAEVVPMTPVPAKGSLGLWEFSGEWKI